MMVVTVNARCAFDGESTKFGRTRDGGGLLGVLVESISAKSGPVDIADGDDTFVRGGVEEGLG